MDYESKLGSGILGVHAFPHSTGIFTVVPTSEFQLKEGFYQFTMQNGLYTNFNPSIVINKHSHMSYDEYQDALNSAGHNGVTIKGMGISGLMTEGVFGYKKLKSLF
jgi:hypothetical protein